VVVVGLAAPQLDVSKKSSLVSFPKNLKAKKLPKKLMKLTA
jgi:hypothetical protein